MHEYRSEFYPNLSIKLLTNGIQFYSINSNSIQINSIQFNGTSLFYTHFL